MSVTDSCALGGRIVVLFSALEPHQVGKKGTVMSFLWRTFHPSVPEGSRSAFISQQMVILSGFHVPLCCDHRSATVTFPNLLPIREEPRRKVFISYRRLTWNVQTLFVLWHRNELCSYWICSLTWWNKPALLTCVFAFCYSLWGTNKLLLDFYLPAAAVKAWLHGFTTCTFTYLLNSF